MCVLAPAAEGIDTRLQAADFATLLMLFCFSVLLFFLLADTVFVFLNRNWEAKAVDTSFGLLFTLLIPVFNFIFLTEGSKTSAWEIFFFFIVYLFVSRLTHPPGNMSKVTNFSR